MAKEKLETYVRSENYGDDYTTISVKIKDMDIGCSEDYVFPYKPLAYKDDLC